MPDTTTIIRRRNALLSCVDIDGARGLEIGPYDRPIVPKSLGDVIYADMRSGDELRRITNPASGRVVEDIVDVDKILDPASPYVEGPFDYIIASHVIEHVPDPVGWLNGWSKELKPDGLIFLVVPDKDHIFDALRPVTTLGQLLSKHRDRADKPTYAEVFDAFYYHINFTAKERIFSLQRSLEMAEKSDSEYVGCHCNVHTYEQFLNDFNMLYEMGELKLQISGSWPVEAPFNDFICVMSLNKLPFNQVPLCQRPQKKRRIGALKQWLLGSRR